MLQGMTGGDGEQRWRIAAGVAWVGDAERVALVDTRRGAQAVPMHVHPPFGEGDMDVPACLDALEAVGFQKLVCVELSRESHRADTMIPQSIDWLRSRRGRA